MKKSIFRSLLFFSIISCLCTVILVASCFIPFYQNTLRQQMKADLNTLVYGYDQLGISFLENTDTSVPYRITLISVDGTVLYDSEQELENLSQHDDRIEVLEAMEHGVGEAERYSSSFGQKYYYYALQTEDNTILRISTPLTSYYQVFIQMIPFLILLFILFILVILYIANKQVNRIIKPLNSKGIFLEKEDNVYPELDPFYQLIEEQKIEIKHHLKELRRQQQEFEAITEEMLEGLLVLNRDGDVLSINQSAISLLQAKNRSYLGENYLVVSRNPNLQEAVITALNNQQNQTVIELDGKMIQIHASPVIRKEELRGVLLLILDITEQYQSQQLRREFTANVTHELKTPLTSIVGYSELLQTGSFNQEEQEKFIDRILEEGNRLITLIDDIMLLSGLDESRLLDMQEQIDLAELFDSVLNRLTDSIQAKNITVKQQYQSIFIQGNKRLLEELFYNLIENGIKYNQQDGILEMITNDRGNEVEVVIKDTGMGIPKKDFSRLFERFYRGENGTNNAISGSGLGLSIVKHIAELHQIAISVSSEVNQGTEFRLYIKRK